MRKTIIIIIVLLIIAAGGYFAWQLLITPDLTQPPTVNQIEPEGVTKLSPQLKSTSSVPVFDYWINHSTNEIYYLASVGEIYKINKAGQEEKIMAGAADPHSLTAFADGSKAIISFGYPAKTIFSVFDTSSKSWRPLPSGIIAAAGDPKNNNRLVYLKDNGPTTSINLLTFNDNKSRELIKLAQKDLDIEWLLPNEIYLTQKPSSEIVGFAWSFDVNKKAFRQIAKDETGLNIKWSRDGLLGLKISDLTDFLQLNDNNTNTIKLLRFITVPSKCLLKSKIYCAVPRSIPPRTKLPGDYLKRKIYFQDDIFESDITGSSAIKIFDGESAVIDAENLQLKNNQLLFINRYDQKLYSLEIQ